MTGEAGPEVCKAEGNPVGTARFRWAVMFSVDGDARFLSHLDMMRAMERAVVRAGLPLRYSMGFNPRPEVSLVCPRPVAVASADDMLVVGLRVESDGERIERTLNRQTPRGVRFYGAKPLAGRKSPLAKSARYELPVDERTADFLRAGIAELLSRPSWPVRRATVTRDKKEIFHTIDIRPMVRSIRLEAGRLVMELAGRDSAWARPAELLDLLGLNRQENVSRLVRAAVEYELPAPRGGVGQNNNESPDGGAVPER